MFVPRDVGQQRPLVRQLLQQVEQPAGVVVRHAFQDHARDAQQLQRHKGLVLYSDTTAAGTAKTRSFKMKVKRFKDL